MSYEQMQLFNVVLTTIIIGFIYATTLPVKSNKTWHTIVYGVTIAAVFQAGDMLFSEIVKLLEQAGYGNTTLYLNTIWSVLVYVLVGPVICYFVSKESFKRCVLAGAIVMISLMVSEFLAGLIIWPIWFGTGSMVVEDLMLASNSRIIMLAGSAPLAYFSFFIVNILTRPKKTRRRLSFLLFIPLWYATAINALLYFMVRQCGISIEISVPVCSLIANGTMLVCTVLLLRYMDQYILYRQSLDAAELTKRENALKQAYLELSGKLHAELEHVRKEAYSAVQEAECGGKETDSLTQAMQNIAKLSRVSYCADPLLNSILSLKAKKAAELSLDMDIQVGRTETGNIKSIDLCSILANLLDNAIEATQRTSPEARTPIYVCIHTRNAQLFISVENPIAESEQPVCVARALPQTTKRDATQHGFGLSNVRESTERYDGGILLERREATFHAAAMLHI